MNTRIARTLAAACALACAGAFAATGSKVVEKIAFHGFVKDGAADMAGRIVTFDFKLYSGEDTKSAELLWARQIPVTLDKEGGFYVDLEDGAGNPYQASDGTTARCATLADAMSRHAQLSQGAVWIAYDPVGVQVEVPPPREGLYYQPVALRTVRAKSVECLNVGSVSAESVAATCSVVADRIVCKGAELSIDDLRYVVPDKKVELNPNGSVRLRAIDGFSAVSATGPNGEMSRRLPATADADCGRVVRRPLASGKTTHETIFYSAGDSTAAPDGSTTLYIWTFGELEDGE